MASNLARRLLGRDVDEVSSPTAGFRLWPPGEDPEVAANEADYRVRTLRAKLERTTKMADELGSQLREEEAAKARHLAEVAKGAPLFDDLRSELEQRVRTIDGPAADTREERGERRIAIAEMATLANHLARSVRESHPPVHRELKQLVVKLDSLHSANQG